MKGIYVLEMDLKRSLDIEVGVLGMISFSKGSYAYVGSAQRCMEKRIERHLADTKRKHWHIDYLLEEADIENVFIAELEKEQECITARKLSDIHRPIVGFGCSDCDCSSHLFKLNGKLNLKKFERL